MQDGIKSFGEGLPYRKSIDCKGKLIVIEGTDGVGRTTQVELLTQWLKLQGYGVTTTGWTRSQLMNKAITYAKSGNMLDRMTFSLLYAIDFADRLENEIIPALESGFIVIADRYVYTAWARDSLRDPKQVWIKDLYGFAPIPHLTLYLRIDVDNLIPRVIESGGMDYWESGMDLHLADNIFDSFKKYQHNLIERYDQIAEQNGFEVIDARRSVDEIQNELRQRIEKVLGTPADNVVPIHTSQRQSLSQSS
jgi:dTMP kinase